VNPLPSTKESVRQWFKSIGQALHIPAADPVQLARRIRTMELDIMLPLKVAGFFMLMQSEYFKAGLGAVSEKLKISIDAAKSFFWLYMVANAGVAAVLLGGRRLSLSAFQWTAFSSSLVDCLFLTGVALLTGGLDSGVFWLFFGLIIRNAISVPRPLQQHSLNLFLSLLYAASAIVGTSVARGFDEDTRRTLGLTSPEEVGEPLFARMMVLWLLAACCHAVQLMLEHQRHAAEEAREFATRESQLRSAGRLAARIAHQIKNPLGIINNAAFSLRRLIKDEKPEAVQQIEIIREEVTRADQIITELMGYAQLTEGRVERLKMDEELDRLIEEVFPSGIESGVRVHRDYDGGNFPPLLMQRKHISEVISNLLQNAREAMNGGGNIFVTARCRSDYSIEVTVRDDGPGIPRDKLERVFEAYYTTKERGTGLGLAIVKQNMELYGGNVKVESELGKGACFTLLFPAKTLTRLGK
jgi:signal transduction histidine kinase